MRTADGLAHPTQLITLPGVCGSIDFDFDAPYGGFKSSGIERELGGIEGILGFTEARAIGL
jgi:hypothetical protein